MKPEGAVIWLLAGGTVLVVFVLAPLAFSRLRRQRPPAVVITDAPLPVSSRPVRPALDGYTDDEPAPDRAWAVESAPDDDGGR